jgi:carotenoid cleavage dioxygenase
MSKPFPIDDPMLSGAWAPWPMEGCIRDCAVVGEIPRELAGTLYRNGPNPQFAPRRGYHFFGGDGMLHAFRFEDGRCHYRNRWVRTPRFVAERAAGEPLFGSLLEGEPPDPRAAGVPSGPANTNVVWHAGRLLALVEGGLPPVEIDPHTLETRGVFDFAGALAGGVFTAHPKLDAETGEMLAFAYSPFPPYVTYFLVDRDGSLVRSEPIDAPYPSMVHDFAVTAEHVVFPIFPATLRPERMAEGGSPLAWEPELGTRIGVMSRRGPADVRWFETDACYVFHPFNAWTQGRRVVCDMAQYPRLPLAMPGEEGRIVASASLVRWTIDLDGGGVKQEPLDDRVIEFPRFDERRTGRGYRFGYAGSGGRGAVQGFDRIVRYDLASGAAVEHVCGPRDVVGEPVFVPRADAAPEGQGWLLFTVWRAEEDRSDLLVLDAEHVDREPVATVKLPHRVPAGFHGNWKP